MFKLCLWGQKWSGPKCHLGHGQLSTYKLYVSFKQNSSERFMATCYFLAYCQDWTGPCTLALVKADKMRQRNFAPTQFTNYSRSKIVDHGGTSVSPAALIISTTMHDGPAALPDFIFEMAFFTMSIVIGMDRPSSRGSLDTWCPGTHWNSTLRSLS